MRWDGYDGSLHCIYFIKYHHMYHMPVAPSTHSSLDWRQLQLQEELDEEKQETTRKDVETKVSCRCLCEMAVDDVPVNVVHRTVNMKTSIYVLCMYEWLDMMMMMMPIHNHMSITMSSHYRHHHRYDQHHYDHSKWQCCWEKRNE